MEEDNKQSNVPSVAAEGSNPKFFAMPAHRFPAVAAPWHVTSVLDMRHQGPDVAAVAAGGSVTEENDAEMTLLISLEEFMEKLRTHDTKSTDIEVDTMTTLVADILKLIRKAITFLQGNIDRKMSELKSETNQSRLYIPYDELFLQDSLKLELVINLKKYHRHLQNIYEQCQHIYTMSLEDQFKSDDILDIIDDIISITLSLESSAHTMHVDFSSVFINYLLKLKYKMSLIITPKGLTSFTEALDLYLRGFVLEQTVPVVDVEQLKLNLIDEMKTPIVFLDHDVDTRVSSSSSSAASAPIPHYDFSHFMCARYKLPDDTYGPIYDYFITHFRTFMLAVSKMLIRHPGLVAPKLKSLYLLESDKLKFDKINRDAFAEGEIPTLRLSTLLLSFEADGLHIYTKNKTETYPGVFAFNGDEIFTLGVPFEIIESILSQLKISGMTGERFIVNIDMYYGRSATQTGFHRDSTRLIETDCFSLLFLTGKDDLFFGPELLNKDSRIAMPVRFPVSGGSLVIANNRALVHATPKMTPSPLVTREQILTRDPDTMFEQPPTVQADVIRGMLRAEQLGPRSPIQGLLAPPKHRDFIRNWLRRADDETIDMKEFTPLRTIPRVHLGFLDAKLHIEPTFKNFLRVHHTAGKRKKSKRFARIRRTINSTRSCYAKRPRKSNRRHQ
jgi:hypothetical protein